MLMVLEVSTILLPILDFWFSIHADEQHSKDLAAIERERERERERL